MAMVKLLITVPKRLKVKLDVKRKRGTSAAGLIRHLLGQYFKGQTAASRAINQEGVHEK